MGKCIPPLCGGVYVTKRTFGAKIVRPLQLVNHPIHKIGKNFMLSRHLGFQRVIFDCDMTLVAVEGIDELARLKGQAEYIADLTRQAMDGKIPLEEVYAKRLELLRPTRGEHGEVEDGFLPEGEVLGQRREQETRASAAILVALTLFLMTAVSLLNPEYIRFFTSENGRLILIGIAVWPIIGVIVMKRILALKF